MPCLAACCLRGSAAIWQSAARPPQRVSTMSTVSKLSRQLRCLVDSTYRRAWRSFRHLPRIDYRTVVDAGANRGSFADALLQLHKIDRLVAVEALPHLAEHLRNHYQGRPGISVVAAALADKNGEATFEVNRFEDSSSLLKIDPRNSAWFALDLAVRQTITVPTVSLPELLAREKLERVDLLKLDLQGAERLVLTGGAAVLDRVRVVFSEVLFERLYEDAWLFWETNDFLKQHGFRLCGLSNVVHSTDGDILQANATFRKPDATQAVC